MHEYAYSGRGNTIHSPGQIEWFQYTCDDKSFHVGGKQVITFLDGYATPLHCRTGLMYMNLLGDRILTKMEPCLTPTLMDEGQARNPNTTYNGYIMEFWKFALTWKLICQVQHK